MATQLPNLSLLPRLQSITETRTFTHKQMPGFSLELTFEVEAGYPQALFIGDKANRILTEYAGQGKDLYTDDMEAIPLSGQLADEIAFLLSVDRTNTGTTDDGSQNPRFSIKDWAMLSSRAYPIYQQVIAFGVELRSKARKLAGLEPNEQGVDTKNG